VSQVCDHCDVMSDVLIRLFGNEVGAMIMERVSAQVHDHTPHLADGEQTSQLMSVTTPTEKYVCVE
jgi:hypothetical protein